MFAHLLAVVATASLVNAADTIPNYHVHGSVVFVRTGERTPSLRPGTQILTALGAQQMYRLGQNFRTRYINEIGGPDGLGIQQIPGMSPDLLNSDQMLIQTIDMPYLATAAQAFMQGLYPPYTINGTGPLADRTGLLANGTAIDFPLNGYQYGRVQTVGQYDPQSIYIAGNLNCPASQRDAMMYFTTKEFLETKAENKDFYTALDLDWFEGNLKEDQLDFAYALEIFDYLEYAVMHNPDARDRLLNDTTMAGVYDRLRYLADIEAWYVWGNTSSVTAAGYQHAIAGKTLAALILGQFQKIVDNQGNTTNGHSDPITFLFGEQDPMISLFSLMEISYSSPSRFRSIPPFGSSIVLELFTTGRDNSFPTNMDDLWVRFGFINGTNYGGGNITAYPMFRNGPSITDMKWPEFQDKMSRIMTNTVADWCDTCNSYSLFCTGVDGSGVTIITDGSKNRKSKVSPAVAGVIGAIITLAIAGLLFAAAMVLGGVRFHRIDRSKKSELGGFKGSAKLASDADLSLPKNAAAPAGIVSFGAGDNKRGHERVGSWELRQKEFGPKSGDLGDESRRASFDAIDEAVARPVQPHERI